jgi:HSP20 family protein
MQDELCRVFGRQGNGAAASRTLAGPGVNIWEDETTVYAESDLPGMSLDKLEVLVADGDQLTIQGERIADAPAGVVWHRQERGLGRFTRQVQLPAMVDADRVEAKYEHGVLRLTMPKSRAALPKKIQVQAG